MMTIGENVELREAFLWLAEQAVMVIITTMSSSGMMKMRWPPQPKAAIHRTSLPFG